MRTTVVVNAVGHRHTSSIRRPCATSWGEDVPNRYCWLVPLRQEHRRQLPHALLQRTTKLGEHGMRELALRLRRDGH